MTATAVMQPTGNEVSAEAFRDHRRSGRVCASQEVVILALRASLISGVETMTRNELAEKTGLPLSSVCGRCRELLDCSVLTVDGTTKGKPARQLLRLTALGRFMAEGFAIQKEEAASHASA